MNEKLQVGGTNSTVLRQIEALLKRNFQEMKSLNHIILCESRSGCISIARHGGRRRVTAPPAGWGKVKWNGSVCLRGNEQGPLDQKG